MLDGTAASAADADDAGGREAEMRAEVVRTVVEQLRGSEIACARHVFGSVALARVLSAATNAQRTSLAAPILERGQPLTLLSDKYASHVVEAVLAIAAAEAADAAGGGVAGLIAPFVDRLCEPDAAGGLPLAAVMRDRHGTYVARALLHVLSGRPYAPRGTEGGPEQQPGRPAASRGAGSGSGSGSAATDEQPRPVPASFGRALQRLTDALLGGGGVLTRASRSSDESGRGDLEMRRRIRPPPLAGVARERVPRACRAARLAAGRRRRARLPSAQGGDDPR